MLLYILKNNLAVKKDAALFKMASMKKIMKSNGWPRSILHGFNYSCNPCWETGNRWYSKLYKIIIATLFHHYEWGKYQLRYVEIQWWIILELGSYRPAFDHIWNVFKGVSWLKPGAKKVRNSCSLVFLLAHTRSAVKQRYHLWYLVLQLNY